MHIHTTHVTASGNALAGAQSAETANALRRARELREAAGKLKAGFLDLTSEISSENAVDPETVAMIGAWVGPNASSSQVPAAQDTAPDSDTSGSSRPAQQVERVQRPPSPRPVSFWA